MNLKIKLNFAKSVATIIGLLCVSISSFVFQGCEKDELLFEYEDIAQSAEFNDYLNAQVEFIEKVNQISDKKQVIGQIKGKNIYKSNKSINSKSFYNAVETRSKLIQKYPEYAQIDILDKNLMVEKAVIKSEKLSEKYPINQTSYNVRLKNGVVENPNSSSSIINKWFKFFEDAINACRNYSQANNNVESGGYILPDGRGLFIIDKNATDTSMVMPVFKNGMPVGTKTFHFHDVSPYPSAQDSSAMQFMRDYGVDSLLIITPNEIFRYGGF